VLKDFQEKQVHEQDTLTTWRSRGHCRRGFHPTKNAQMLVPTVPPGIADAGVDSNLSDAGHEDSNLLAGNNTDAARAKNRRVEVIVT
jgi:hypothetical protein